MDRRKLNKAAVQNEYNQAWTKHTHTTSFKNGANWLMQQPLSERLTKEEKEKIRHCMNEANYQKCGYRIGDEKLNEFRRIQSDTVIAVFNYIFGAELFKK